MMRPPCPSSELRLAVRRPQHYSYPSQGRLARRGPHPTACTMRGRYIKFLNFMNDCTENPDWVGSRGGGGATKLFASSNGKTDMVSSHGRFVWYELTTTDMEAAKAFYAEVVGWGARDASMPGMPYTVFTAGEASVSGMME